MLADCFFLCCVLASSAARAGDTLWLRRWNGPGNLDDRPVAVMIDSAKNVIVAGFSYSAATDHDCVVLKYDSTGRLLWSRIYNSPLNSEDRIVSAAQDNDGNIYVTGSSLADPKHNWDYLTIKYYPTGETAWQRYYDAPFHDEDKAAALAVDDSGNVYVTGASRNHKRSWDFLTIKYNSRGDTVWTRRFDGPPGYDDQASAITVDREGNIIVTGKSADEDRRPLIITVKYDRSGRLMWKEMFRGTGPGHNSPSRVLADAESNVYVGGAASSAGVSYDCVLVKYRGDGRYQWSRVYDGPGHRMDIANDLALSPDGGIVLIGQSMGSGTFSDYVTIKYSPQGDTLWCRRYDGAAHHEDRARAVAVDPEGNSYVTGGSILTQPYESFVTIAYTPHGDSLWLRSYAPGGSGNSRATAITTRFDRVAVVGFSVNENNDLDIVTIVYRR